MEFIDTNLFTYAVLSKYIASEDMLSIMKVLDYPSTLSLYLEINKIVFTYSFSVVLICVDVPREYVIEPELFPSITVIMNGLFNIPGLVSPGTCN